MNDKIIACDRAAQCIRYGARECSLCKNNKVRNIESGDWFIEAEDNPIPVECPKLTYSGPAEHTAGYKCPVCGEYTNPYRLVDYRCEHCGYKLNCCGRSDNTKKFTKWFK